jgi:hypothetical protein
MNCNCQKFVFFYEAHAWSWHYYVPICRDEIQRIKAGNPDISHREAFSAAAKNVRSMKTQNVINVYTWFHDAANATLAMISYLIS